MAIWPATLPSDPLASGFSPSREKVFIDDEAEVGTTRRRARYTASPRSFRADFRLTTAQTRELDTFYETDLNQGVDSFTWVEPLFNTAVNLKFVEYPDVQRFTKGVYDVSCQFIEILS